MRPTCQVPFFLAQLPWLQGFCIQGVAGDAASIEPIHNLHLLRELKDLTYNRTPIRFDCFPQLERCSIEWRSGSSSIFKRISLKQLFINCYTGKSSGVFSPLVSLEELTLYNSSLHDLEGFRTLTKLKTLAIANFRSLRSLSGIEGLTNLESLKVTGCRIQSIEEIAGLCNLKRLHLNNCHEIASLAPICRLSKLENLDFIESTNVKDGDLGPIAELPSLKKVIFQNRRHYSHNREDFWQFYGVRKRRPPLTISLMIPPMDGG
jgi:Leucine-rich repeat (LRR) protein